MTRGRRANEQRARGVDEIAVGLDIGGTWLRLIALRGNRRVASLVLPARRTEKDLPRLLRDIWKRKGWSSRRVAALVVASRGIWTARECRAVARSLASLARHVTVLADAQAALLGALDGRPGLLILSGTGSIVVGRDERGRWARAGGFGPLLGDEGSGFWIGREWLRATTRGEDMFPARRLIRSAEPVARIAALAPRVLARARHGDSRARAIVRDGQAHLAAFALDVARTLRLAQPISVSWAGSVLANEWFRAGVARALSRSGVRIRWSAPAAEPVAAAARLAQEIATTRG